MIKTIFILLYLWKGQVVLHQSAHADETSCIEAAKALAKELNNDPRFGGAYYADCVELEATEAKK